MDSRKPLSPPKLDKKQNTQKQQFTYEISRLTQTEDGLFFYVYSLMLAFSRSPFTIMCNLWEQ